jgi:REP element-mobilizing transposase RayT
MYRRVIFDEGVEKDLREICLEISLRYEIEFVEIGTDEDHVHFFPTLTVYTTKSQ